MPSHKTHDTIAIYAAAVIAPASYATLRLLGDDPGTAYTGTLVVLTAHAFGTWLLSPDLDLDSRIDDRWGPLRPLWIPYMRIVPHRSWFSHSGISGALRLLYLYGAICLVLYGLTLLGQVLNLNPPNYYQVFADWVWGAIESGSRPAWLIVAGVVVSDVVHVAADMYAIQRRRWLRARVRTRRRRR